MCKELKQTLHPGLQVGAVRIIEPRIEGKECSSGQIVAFGDGLACVVLLHPVHIARRRYTSLHLVNVMFCDLAIKKRPKLTL